MAFLLRAERTFAERRSVQLDHGLLVAALAAQQAASAAARAEARGREASAAPGCAQEPLVRLLLGGSGWPAAARAQAGSFHRSIAEQRVNQR